MYPTISEEEIKKIRKFENDRKKKTIYNDKKGNWKEKVILLLSCHAEK